MAKKALLVGLNHYPDPRNNLKGCINDVLMMSKLLQENFGFDDINNIRLLTDERATTQAIRDRLEWLVKDAKAGDVLVFHYSGHGAQVRDRDGDELKDHMDEMICPYDLDWDNPFTDDDLHNIFKDLKPEVNLTVVLDCCHSGNGLREMIRPDMPNRPKFLVPPPDIQHRTNPVIEDLGVDKALTMTKPKKELKVAKIGQKAAKGGALLVSACRANQVADDAWINGDFHGALTFYFYKVVSEAQFKISYSELVEKVRADLKAAHHRQVPQLEGPKDYMKEQLFGIFK